MKTNIRNFMFTLALLVAGVAEAQTTFTSAGDAFAWGANFGWMDFAPQRPNPGDGVRVTDTHLSGYAWSGNIGWINFGDNLPANLVRFANTNADDFGVNHDGAGNLSGLAWAPNAGWINFGWAATNDANRPRFDIQVGNFLGYAWSGNVGWINLGAGLLRTESIAITDKDHDGISDAWEMEHAGNLTTLTATGDADNDGRTDKEEYLADTNPLVPNGPFLITRFTKTGPSFYDLEWPSTPTRLYGIEAKQSVTETNWIVLGDVPGAAGTNTIQPLNLGVPQVFLRIGAKLPLQP